MTPEDQENELALRRLAEEQRLRAADALFAHLRRGPRTRKELADLGLDIDTAMIAVGDVAFSRGQRIRVGPFLLDLESEDDGRDEEVAS